MAYRALDIANYITSYALKNGKKIYHLQLQKILYYLEAAHLVKKGVPLFQDDIEKWKLGPVVPDVYHNYKIFGAETIPYVPKEVKINSDLQINFVSFDEGVIDVETKKFIEKYVDELLQFDSFQLVEFTHEHEPWKRDEGKIMLGIRNIKYDKTELKDYFKNNPEELEKVGIR